MDKYLIFRLYGNLSSWGSIAIGEERRIMNHPTRSSILGIISAALGIKRDQTELLENLFSSFEIGVKEISSGQLIQDFHTIQIPKNIGKYQYQTRKEEIEKGREHLNTIISTREYFCDSNFIVAIRNKKNNWDLEDIQNHLLKQKFIIYLGRKSCPVCIPMQPQIVESKGFKGALNSGDFISLLPSRNSVDRSKVNTIKSNNLLTKYFWEGESLDLKAQQSFERYDDPVNNERWQFCARIKHYAQEIEGEICFSLK